MNNLVCQTSTNLESFSFGKQAKKKQKLYSDRSRIFLGVLTLFRKRYFSLRVVRLTSLY